ncbi:MAG: tRNA 2-thiouridine(34) synthase MnmA [Actinomycetota bacterium]|nr:tRNA 2-thiouridine(34) synthase MnmA [Actinomycetota bacterium]
MENNKSNINRHFKEPCNEGEIPDPDSSGISRTSSSSDFVKFTANITGNIISDIKFKASGCSYTKASAGCLTTLIKNRDILNSTLTNEKDIEDCLGNFPSGKKYIPGMAIDALRKLITNYISNPLTPEIYKIDNNRIAVALSGGIDSSMAAKILKEKGYRVIGVTLKLLPDNFSRLKKTKTGTYEEDIKSAIKVSARLGIPHVVIDFTELFEDKIIRPFCLDYKKGLTPNPCVECNKYIKFGALLEKIKVLGAAFLATGHYCIIKKSSDSGLYEIQKSTDKKKDQSYILWKLNQKQLSHIKTPLGTITKTDMRKAVKKSFPFLKNARESQDICFIPDKDYRLFLKSRINDIGKGPILDTGGNIIGKHSGYVYYTIGQRKGLGVSRSRPLYVKEIIPEKNIIIAGYKEDIFNKFLKVKNTNFISGKPPGRTFRAMVKIRYSSKEAPASIIITGTGTADIIFDKSQKAVTPGQSAVFYDDFKLIGGGIIKKIN